MDKNQVLKKLQMMEVMYVPYARATNMPFIVCDEETYNDQIFIFREEKDVQVFAKEYTAKSIPLMGVKFKNDQFLNFYTSLFTMGVNAIVYTEGEETVELELLELVQPPDYSQLPEEKRPLSNPQLQLTGLYFMQELRRKVDNEEKKNLPELEEEMAANLVKARYIVSMRVNEKDDEEVKKRKKSEVQVPFVKNNNGEIFQPVFTDVGEFNKFNREKNLKGVVMNFDKLQSILMEQSKGIVVNPLGFNLIILKEQIPAFVKRFEQE